MKRRDLIVMLGSLPLLNLFSSRVLATEQVPPGAVEQLFLSDGEWCNGLTPEQFDILRREATEAAGSSPLKGIFHCIACEHYLYRAGLLLIIFLFASTAWADMPLSERYQRLKSGADVTLPGTAISLTSSEQQGLVSADVNTILPYPFNMVAPTLSKAQNWCQFMPLHFNIKACTCEPRKTGELLTLYSGRKTYQHPEDSFALAYRFEVAQQDVGQLLLHLHAESGPAGTRDYVLDVGALKVKEGTLLHVHISYRTSFTSSLLTRGYLSTIGREKIGFTRIIKNGKPHPVQGVRGVIERNVMRYQFAIVAYLNTQSLQAASRHEAALTNWFKQNDSFPQQLHEMTEKEYLEIKHKEWNNQQKLQQAQNNHCN